MGYHDYTIYTNSVLIGHLLSYNIMVGMDTKIPPKSQ